MARKADITNFSGSFGFQHCFCGSPVCEDAVRIFQSNNFVKLQEIDLIGLQPSQRFIDLLGGQGFGAAIDSCLGGGRVGHPENLRKQGPVTGFSVGDQDKVLWVFQAFGTAAHQGFYQGRIPKPHLDLDQKLAGRVNGHSVPLLLGFGLGIAMPLIHLQGCDVQVLGLLVMAAVGLVAKLHRQSAHRVRMSRGESGRSCQGSPFRQLLTDLNCPLFWNLAVPESGQLTLTKVFATTATPQAADLVFAIDLANDEVVLTASTLLLTVGI